MTKLVVHRVLTTSEEMVEKARDMKRDALGQLYDDARLAVRDEVAQRRLTPMSGVTVFIRLEQWCEDAL